MIGSILILTFVDALIIALIIALISIGYVQLKNRKYQLEIKRVQHEYWLLDQKLTDKEEEIKMLLSQKERQSALYEEMLNTLKNEIVITDKSTEAEKLCLLSAQLQFQIAYERRLTEDPKKRKTAHQSFESKLELLYPQLTLDEREVCTLFSLRLSVKEIMKIRNLSFDTIELLRKQIRKKMNIPTEIELEKFIQELT